MRRKKKPLAYLAHPFCTKDTELEKEFISIAKQKGFRIYEPFRSEKDLEKKYKSKYYDSSLKKKRLFAKDITEKDLKALKKSDVTIAFLPIQYCIDQGFPSIGTIFEIATAYHNKKYIILISESENPFIINFANELYKSLYAWKLDIQRW